MNPREMRVELELPINSSKRMIYTIDNENNDTIAHIFIKVHTRENERENKTSILFDYYMYFNDMYEPTEQEINSAEFLFRNLVNVVQYDLSHTIDIDLSRINDILPIKVKINKIRKGEEINGGKTSIKN